MSHLDPIALLAQYIGKELAHLAIVINDENRAHVLLQNAEIL